MSYIPNTITIYITEIVVKPIYNKKFCILTHYSPEGWGVVSPIFEPPIINREYNHLKAHSYKFFDTDQRLFWWNGRLSKEILKFASKSQIISIQFL